MWFLFSFIACMPKIWQKTCDSLDNCAHFTLVKNTGPSAQPFEVSRDDVSSEIRVNSFQLTDKALLATTEIRDLCRGMHLGYKTYAITPTNTIHKLFRKYTTTTEVLYPGDYYPCGEWEPSKDIQLQVKFPGSTSTKPVVSLGVPNKNNKHELSFVSLGLALLENPTYPVLDLFSSISDTKDISFTALLPEKNSSWVCEATQSLQNIQATGDVNTWKLQFQSEEQGIQLDYIYNNNPRLLSFTSSIQKCPKSTQLHLQDVIASSAVTHPESYAHLNYLYSSIFGKKLTKPRGAKSSSGTVSKTNNSAPKNTNIVGTYNCSVNGQQAYFRLYRNGVFNLKVEMQNGSASGSCSKNNCNIESIYKNAVAFTGSVNNFTISPRNNVLILNNSTRCERTS